MTSTQALALIDNPLVRALPHPTRWADLGCGSGLFTLTLAGMLQPGSTVYAIDRYPTIAQQQTANGVSIEPQTADFVKDHLTFKNIDGILMANSFHYVKNKLDLLSKLQSILSPNNTFVIVEYDRTKSVPIWVPHPLSFALLQPLFRNAGYSSITRLGEMPSAFGGSNLYGAIIN